MYLSTLFPRLYNSLNFSTIFLLPPPTSSRHHTMASFFEYPITRPFTIKYFTLVVIVLGGVWVGVVLCLAIAAVGYETSSVNSDSINASSQLWYERVFPQSGWFPASRTCKSSIIKIAESNYLLTQKVIEGLTVHGTLFYSFVSFLDVTTDGPIDGMVYRNYAVRNCSVLRQSIVPYITPEAKAEV